MIKTFKHQGLRNFYETGSKSGIQPHHASRLKVILTAMSVAKAPADLKAAVTFKAHQLSGELNEYWSLSVNANWRIIFKFDGDDIELVDYLDYH
jgi:proteic killer suppression protein